MPTDTIANPTDRAAPSGVDREALLAFENDLPALPATMGKLLRLIEDPNSSLDEITILASGDASLSAQLLKVANPAMFSQSGDICDLGQAIGTIGLSHLKTVLFTRTVSRLQLEPSPAQDLVRDNSIATGVAALIIAERLRRKDANQLFLCAVLHRLGQFVLLSHPQTKDRYHEVLDHIRREHVSYSDAEMHVLGVSHTWIGGMLARRWNFPLDFVHILLHYENQGDGLDREMDHLCELIRLADEFAMASGKGTPKGYPADQTALLQAGQFNCLFPTESRLALKRFLAEMDTKWAAARSVWPA
jgi:HD-like signal output (HDOD) protein